MMRMMLSAVCVAMLSLAGCASPSPGGNAGVTGDPATELATGNPMPGGTAEAGRPVAYINGKLVTAEALRQPLLELAGGQVLSEAILDAMIQRRLAEAELSLTPALIEAERALLIEAVGPDLLSEPGGEVDADQAVRLLREVRRRRGLGDRRFEALLRRNAGLRLLVQPDIEVTPQAVRQAHHLRYGQRYTARILVVPTLQEAGRLRDRLTADPSLFAELAVEHSTDPSAVQGGLLPPISPADPAVPPVIRDALVNLDRAERTLSDVIAIDHGFALLRLERKRAAQAVELADVQDQLASRVRLETERVLMQQLARELIAEARVIVLDPALEQSWQLQKDALLGQ